MALQIIKKLLIGKKQEEALNSSGTKTGMHGNYYELTEEDRAKAEEVKRINREIKKRKALRDAYIEKLLDDKEIAQIKSEINQIHGEQGDGDLADSIFQDTIMQLLANNGMPVPSMDKSNPQQEQDFYSDEIVQSANTFNMPIEEQDYNVSYPKNTRFTDEEIEKNISKLLNEQQIKYLKQLSPDEVQQVYDVISKKSL
jgi:hypothetical protein